MTTATVWILIFALAYGIVAVAFARRRRKTALTERGPLLACRRLPSFILTMAVTATGFCSWAVIGHPAQIFRDGLPYASISLVAVTIALAGALFMKRQWLLGRRFGYMTMAEMFADYFRSEHLRYATVALTFLGAFAFTGLALRAAGLVANALTGGLLGATTVMWLLAALVLFSVSVGGLRAVGRTAALQCLLFAASAAGIAFITLEATGGWEALASGIADLVSRDGNRGPNGHSHYIAVPGIIQFVANGSRAAGGPWTGLMIASVLAATAGIQASPVFSMWAFAAKTPRFFSFQQVFLCAAGMGLLLVVGAVVAGMGGHLLGADPLLLATGIYPDLLLTGDNMESAALKEALVPQLILLAAGTAPWLTGFFAVSVLAAAHTTASVLLLTAASMLDRDVLPRCSKAESFAAGKKRAAIAVIALPALLAAIFFPENLELTGGLAAGLGLQLSPALFAVCYWPWLTRTGVVWGLYAGIAATILTDPAGIELCGISLWGPWPLTMHSAGWGILCNAGMTVAISLFSQHGEETAHRKKFHDFFQRHAAMPATAHGLKPVAWSAFFSWFVLAAGPGAVVGSSIFGNPRDAETWIFGLPSLWVWQIFLLVAGIFLVWLVADKMAFSTITTAGLQRLATECDDAG